MLPKSWFLIVFLAVTHAGGVFAQQCEPYQLEAYRQSYSNSEQCWAGERGLKGATRNCCKQAFGGEGCGAEEEVRQNIDWVLVSDAGARATYERLRASGLSPFEAVVGAQAHNPKVQALLRRCQATADAYLSGSTKADTADSPRNRRVSRADCRCVSVTPTNAAPDINGRLSYRVFNACADLEISVLFGRDIARLSPNPKAFEGWANAGFLGSNQERIVLTPGGTIVSINAVRIRTTVSSVTCPML